MSREDGTGVSVHHDAMQHSIAHGTGQVRLGFAARAWIAALIIYVTLVPTGILTPAAARIVTDTAWTIAAMLAALSSYRAARVLDGSERTAWMLLAAGCAAWSCGQLAWSAYELILEIPSPFPSIADIGYLLFGPLMIAGVLVLRSTLSGRRLTWLRVANLGLVLCSLAVVLMVVLTQPFTHTTYPLGSALIVFSEKAAITVACIISMYTLWSYSWGSRLPAMALITAALVVHTIAGVFYTRELIIATYSVTSVYNVLWLGAFALQDGAGRSRLAAALKYAESGPPEARTKQGWVEALLPGALLLFMSINAIALAQEITQQVVYFASLMLAVFAVVLSLRESLLYSRGQQTQATLESATAELEKKTEQFQALNVRHEELGQEIEAMARAGGVGLWDWDVGSPIVRYSREWKHQLGYDEDEFPNTFEAWRTVLHPDDIERMSGAIAAFVENPVGEFIAEQRLRHRDGSYRWILVRGTAIFDAKGKPHRMLGSHVDITDRKVMELSLRDSETRYRELVNELESRVAARTSELTDAYRESRNFAYAVAHDLKAPLRAIDGFGHLLDNSASHRLNAEEKEYLRRVRRGAVQMSSLIDGLLDYSRLEHRELRFCAIESRELIEDILHSMESIVHAANATVAVTVAPGRVRADVEGLRIIIRNLLDNALKFSSRARTPRIDIGSYEEAGHIVLTIQDNGIGFDPQYHDKIFEIFNRLHASGYDGTGIGLALVRKAAQRMHGQTWARSAPDQGATFFVRLPIARDDESHASTAASTSGNGA